MSKLSELVNLSTVLEKYKNKINETVTKVHFTYHLMPDVVIKTPAKILAIKVKKICGRMKKTMMLPITIGMYLLLNLLRPNVNKLNPNNITLPFPSDEDQKCKLGNKNTICTMLKLYHTGFNFTFSLSVM